ncbi:EmrB/QacA subfamily drug resistance transporter [Kitasatospora sp. GP30]|uniref:MFS transporter n=1 Tax=Kitasatospora sp. GP30 TaxID=3035084 RepID=UPI000C7062AE|nr:MFS transporter [Kitasatospora sp. GP30]MDH6139618.1 EmrB/QacA subfamily drug resistance transporter [Kitasatospora sp. GP30]
MTTLAPVSNTATVSDRGSGATLAVLLGAYMLIALDATVVSVALPALQRQLHFSATALSWVPNAYALTFGGLLLLGSRVGDVLGRRRAFSAGVALFTVASLLGGLAPNAGLLLAARAVQGVGAALSTPNVLALIAVNFDEGPARNRALSFYSAGAGLGGSLGMLLGGALTSWFSWRWALLINVPIGVVVALAAPRVIQEPERQPGRFDVAGAITGTLGSTVLVYGVLRAADRGWTDALALATLTAAALLLTAFLAVELKARQPLLPLEFLRDRGRIGAYLNMFLIPAGMFPLFFLLTLYFQEVLGYSALRTGLGFLPMTLVLFTTVRLMPRALARVNIRAVLVTGAALVVLGGVWLTQLSEHGGYPAQLLGPLVLIGLGGGMSFMPMSALVLRGVTPARSGAAAGLLQTLQWTGGTVGTAVLVSLFSNTSRHGTGSAAHRLVQGIDAAFVLGTAVAAAAVLVAALVIRHRKA